MATKASSVIVPGPRKGTQGNGKPPETPQKTPDMSFVDALVGQPVELELLPEGVSRGTLKATGKYEIVLDTVANGPVVYFKHGLLSVRPLTPKGGAK